MGYCIYLRKSRKDTELQTCDPLDTLSRHKRILLELANQQHLSITTIYEEVVSGDTIIQRPVMQQLLAEVEQNLWEGVLVMEVERLARGDTIDQGIVAQTFKYSNTCIITPSKTYFPNNEFDEEYFEFGLFMSRREYKTINRRLQRGRNASAQEGKYMGSRPPYGYQRVKLDGQKGFTLYPDPEQAQVVKWIFDWYAFGDPATQSQMGAQKISQRLNEMGVTPQRNSCWSASSVYGILNNPVYIGKIRWRYRPSVKKACNGAMIVQRPKNHTMDYCEYAGLHPSVIDSITWNAVQEKLQRRQTSPVPKNRRLKNPLAGLLKCHLCNSAIIRKTNSAQKSEILICPNKRCKNVGAPLSYVETAVVQALNDWLQQQRFDWEQFNRLMSIPEIDHPTRQMEHLLEQRLEKVLRQISQTCSLLEQGIYSKELFHQRYAELSQQQNSLKIKLNESRQIPPPNQLLPSHTFQKVKNFQELYHSTTDAGIQNQILHQFVDHITYQKLVNGRWHNNLDDFQLCLYVKL